MQHCPQVRNALKLRIPWENVRLEKQKSICEANFAWIFACYRNGVNSDYSSASTIFRSFLVREKVPASFFWIPIKRVIFSLGKLAK